MTPDRTPAWPRHLVLVLGTGFGAGRVPRAPGTAGSVVGLGLGLGLAAAALDTAAVAAITAAICVAGVPICAGAARALGDPDPPAVVWDEIAGMLVALLAIPPGWYWWVAAFVLFRAFDVLKPWPIGWLERRVRGGAGIMLDDLVAGAFAGAAVQALARLAGGGS